MIDDPNFKVPLTKILEINPHPNPKVHSLCIAKVYDFEVVISSKSGYTVGMDVVYFPINSVLPGNIESYLFPADSKIKLEKGRIKAIRIQKFVSQGMIVPWSEIKQFLNLELHESCYYEEDLQTYLNIVKYKPPVKHNTPQPSESKKPQSRNKTSENPYFKEYKGCVNIKWEPHAFSEFENVWISEKIHGSLARFGYLPPIKLTKETWHPKSLWLKIKKFFGYIPKQPNYEWCIGSNHVQRQNKLESPTWYKKDIYSEMADKYDLKNKLKDFPNYVIFSEIIGESVQKGYHYGLYFDERDMVVFDVMYQTETESRWLKLKEAQDFAAQLGLKFVPVLYEGSFNKELVISLATGDSIFCPEQKVIEGVVIKHADVTTLQRKKIKIINPEYLMKEASGETTQND